ncbi:S-layer homology domain-containing protein [Paenibacillus psychroresistens]|uniref:S-layer homology domain-containing protein n=1 Tax=Paenibacillus psychroresistens TaxID=1778678 RepID=A0A6B8RR65_9BACL|nr:S-layer homology domain-containing protein [Paenibacillus psychroresistens]QGQ98880.1 S-layer homology domain-containing protein [Paenibacillus psychroresistens]
MKIKFKAFNAKILALLLVVSLFLPVLNVQASEGISSAGLTAGSFSPIGATYNKSVSHYDYFSDVYPHLGDTNHVFKTVTIEDLDTVLRSEGTYVVLFGGAWSDETQADIGYINQVAKEYGVKTIYNFDTKLDGKDFDIAQTKELSTVTSSTYKGVTTSTYKYFDYAEVYVKFVNTYLTNLNTNTVSDVTYTKRSNKVVTSPGTTTDSTILGSGTAKKITSPFLFVYNKDNKDSNNVSAPIVSYLEKHGPAGLASYNYSNFSSASSVDTYKAQLRAVFGQAQTAGYNTFNSVDNWDFIAPEFNKAKDASVGKDVFVKADDISLVYEHVTYHELTKLLQTKGNYAILFGGSWCPNTSAIIKYVNEYAKKYNVDKVYFWDTKLDSGITVGIPVFDVNGQHNSTFLQVRDTNHPYANLYVDLVKTYLTNINTEYNIASNNVSYVNDGKTVVANKAQVPYLFTYNKDNKDKDGNSAPILGHTELMYNWANIQETANNNGIVGLNKANYVTALKTIFSKLEAKPTGLRGISPTSSTANNGQINGVAFGQEYKLSTVTDYVYVTGDNITNLAPGTYNVRYAAKVGYNGPVTVSTGSGKDRVTKNVAPTTPIYAASESVDVVVPAYSTSTGGNGDPGTGGTPTATPTATPVPTAVPTSGTLAVPSKTDAATGATTASVSTEAVTTLVENAKKDAVAGKSTTVVFKVAATADTKSSELTLPANTFSDLTGSTKADIKIDFGIGTITFDSKAAGSIHPAAGSGDIIIKIAKVELSEESKQVLGDRPVYDFTVTAGGSNVSTFGGGSVSISVPYVLKAGEDQDSVIVYYVTDAGELETIRGKFNAATGTVDFSTTHFSKYIIGYNKVTFADISDSAWYSNAVGFLAAREITSGTGGNKYSPNATVTRGQFIALLLKAYGVKEEAVGSDNYADAGNTYYTNYLAAAKKLGITAGIGNNKFAPDAQITRQDLFTLLYKALDVLGELPQDKTSATVSSFKDASQIAGYAQEAFKILVESGVITGSDSKLNPKGVTTRAQVAQVLYNLFSK